jgi:single-stranded-DNA-specific exonuclease
MKRYRWNRLEQDEQLVLNLAGAINVSIPLARALCSRGIETFDDARFFFRASLDAVPSPFLLHDMQKAVDRVLEAFRCRQKIMIYGDYDVDGTTGTAMLCLFLRELGAEVCYYINDRFREGYGLSGEGIAYAGSQQVSLIITVDCGIRANEAIARCRESGIDVIICDHHEAHELPDAYAILNPKVTGCSYPFRELCGCGVAMKLMQAVVSRLEADQESWKKYLDFVAIATAADMVALERENRVYMREGLQRMQSSPRVNIREMTGLMGIRPEEITMTNIAFGMAPRINAAGRMHSAESAMQWLLSSELSDAVHHAAELERLNTLRREIDAEILTRAESMVEGHFASYCSSIVLYHEEWHLGVLGIVASKILDRYGLPTVIMGGMNGMVKGSVRSIGDLNIYDALQECSIYLEQFGGHYQAAGITLKPENISAFRKRFDEVCTEMLPVEKRQKELVIDSDLELHDITANFMNVLEQFAPFGYGNREPVFVCRSIELSGKPKLLKDRHVKFPVKDMRGRVFDVIGFDRADIYQDIQGYQGSPAITMAFTPERKRWNNREYWQLRLRDIELV